MGILANNAIIENGKIMYRGENLLEVSGETEETRVKEEIENEKAAYTNKLKLTKAEAKKRALAIMREVGIPEPEKRFKQFFFFGKGVNRQKLKAVSDVSFDIREGECLGIVGESGCGKTTTGRSIIRLYDITSGSVYYKGVRISGGTRWNRKEIKWTKIRGNAKIKEIRDKLEKALAALDKSTSNYDSRAEQLKSQADKAVKEIQDRISAARSAQQEKIRQIKYDNAHVSQVREEASAYPVQSLGGA